MSFPNGKISGFARKRKEEVQELTCLVEGLGRFGKAAGEPLGGRLYGSGWEAVAAV